MSCTACGIRCVQPRTLDTSCQILFCSLILVLETYQSWLNFSYLRVDGILLPWYIFYSFILLVPKNSGWRLLLLKKRRANYYDTDLRWKWRRWKIIMLGCSFYSYLWPSGMMLGSLCFRAQVKQSILWSQVGQSRANVVPRCYASEREDFVLKYFQH